MSGKWAVVTGASSGIGRCVAKTLAERGWNVVLHGHRNLAGLMACAQEVIGLGMNAIAVTADIATPQGRGALVQAAFAANRQIGAWINNAGADVLTGESRRWSFDTKLERLWKVDVEGTIALSRLAIAEMQAHDAITTRPSMIHIGWDQANEGMEGDAGQMFGPIKAAVMAFSSSLAKSAAPSVRVNCVAPGWIRTSWGESTSDYWDVRARSESLMERWGTPADIAATIAFLVSDEASFITGQTWNVNGGRRLYLPRSDRNG